MTPNIQRLLDTNADLFDSMTNLLVADSMLEAYRIAALATKKPSEPDLIAVLVCHAMPNLGKLLKPLFQSIGVDSRVTSVFCHGRPQVSRAKSPNGARAVAGSKSAMKPCELGDVLFANFHTAASGKTYRNSILLQAKMSSSNLLTIGPAEEHQLALYEGWGKFTYKETFGLSGQTRDVTPHSAHSGAQYLLIDDRGPAETDSGVLWRPNTYAMGVAVAQKHLAIYASFGELLRKVLAGNNGRTFNDQSVATSDWSQVIWDLLTKAATRTFNQRRVKIVSQPRGVDAILSDAQTSSMFAVSEGGGTLKSKVFDFGGGTPGADNNVQSDNDSGGVSVVVIETRERE